MGQECRGRGAETRAELADSQGKLPMNLACTEQDCRSPSNFANTSMTWKFSRLFMTRLDLQLGDHISGLHISVPLSLYASMKPLRSALGDILFLL